MRAVKDNAAFDKLRERMAAFFASGHRTFSADAHLCFVCGAADAMEGEEPCLRQKFLQWASEHEPDIVCVQAENAVVDLLRQVDERKANRNLAIIENTIANTVDSILIFPESAGSLAELGLFSANERICEKTLVAIRAEHQVDSFITLGPIKQVSVKSAFAPLPIVLAEPLDNSFKVITLRILGDTKKRRAYGKTYEKKDWENYSPREQLALIDAILDITGISTETDLFDLIHVCFGKYEASDVRLLLGLLAALGRVSRTATGDVVRCQSGCAHPLFRMENDEVVDLRAKWIELYTEHVPEAMDEYSEVNA